MSDKLNSAVHTGSSYASSLGLTGIGVWTLQDWAVAVGIAFTVLTFLMSWYYKHKQLQIVLAQAELTNSFHKQEDEDTHRAC